MNQLSNVPPEPAPLLLPLVSLHSPSGIRPTPEQSLPSPSQQELSPLMLFYQMVSFKRPGRSKTEKRFCNRYILPLGARPDAYGNFILRVGESPVLWSCHTDTVHSDHGQQRVLYADGLMRLPNLTQSNCLGADCTSGVWLMIEMIKAQVPGLYIFHRMEEKGGGGSRFIAKSTPELLDGIKFAIAFDRRGKTSVITHQAGLRCASQAFVDSISPMLPETHYIDNGIKIIKTYIADDGGTFTDTANYTDLISECTNISVGYENEHSFRETQSVAHLLSLRSKMIQFDQTKLVAARDHTRREYSDYWGDGHWGAYGRYYSIPTTEFDEASESPSKITNMLRLIKLYPEEVWDLLVEWGYDAKTLAADIEDRRKGYSATKTGG